MKTSHTLILLPDTFAVIQLQAGTMVQPPSGGELPLFALIHTAEETTLVCSEQLLLKSEFANPAWKAERNWRAFKVQGVLAFEMVGILASLAKPLAQTGVSLFTLSTYSTDLVLVKDSQVEQAILAWKKAGNSIIQ